jgi:hypothetical protein
MSRRKWHRGVAGLVVAWLWAGTQPAWAEEDGRFQFDAQGSLQYSRYGFTDIVSPYDGLDTWVEAKATYWADNHRMVGLYLSVIPVYASVSEFWWQRNISGALGLQVFVLSEKKAEDFPWFRGLRLYAVGAQRLYYDEPSGADPEEQDLALGLDYYHDTLFDQRTSWLAQVFLNAGYHTTNFSLEDYDAFLWYGNLKVGPKISAGSSLLVPYGVADWIHSPSYSDRWFENRLGVGGGMAWHPFALEPRVVGVDRPFETQLAERFQVYAEVLANVAWLGDDAPDSVEEVDYRVGIRFSTGGFLGERH